MGQETMRPLAELIGYQEGKALLMESVKPINRTETVDLLSCVDRVLAENVISDQDVPPFARAAMDGYAVMAESTFGAGRFEPKRLDVIGNLHAGDAPDVTVTKESCVQIATGAPMPDGANAVVMVEETERDREAVNIFKPVYPGQFAAPQGQDIKTGGVMFEAGTYLSPAKVGVIAALGKTHAICYACPQISVMPTGNEVVPPGKPLGTGQIYDINSYTLAALIKEHGCVPMMSSIVPDQKDEIRARISGALDDNDMVMLAGGSSVGERDLIIHVLEEMGELKFHGIAVKPGRPTLCAVIDGKLVIGMPGYPTSCLSNGYGFMVDAWRMLARLPSYEPRIVETTLAHRVTSTLGRHQYLMVRLEDGQATQAFKESGAITSMAMADGYIEIPERMDLVEKGAEVAVILF